MGETAAGNVGIPVIVVVDEVIGEAEEEEEEEVVEVGGRFNWETNFDISSFDSN